MYILRDTQKLWNNLLFSKKMEILIPDLEWYLAISKKNNGSPRCPFATVESCPRFYQSLSLLGSAGSTSIDRYEDERLLEKWKSSDLWPTTREQETIIYGNEKFFDRFCPEISYERFGFFASYLGRYADELARDSVHKKLREISASSKDHRWAWSSVTPMHFTECPLYSVLFHRSKDESKKLQKERPDEWYKRPLGRIIIGIVIAVIGGLILAFLIDRVVDNKPTRHVSRDPDTHRTPIYARTKARVDQRVEYLISQKIDPWLMLPSGKMSPITLHDDRILHYGGDIKYEGSVIFVFWEGLIEPFLKDEVRDILDAVGNECIANNIDAGVPLEEATMLLRGMAQRVYARMVYVDQRLRTKPHRKEKASREDVKHKIEKMFKYIDEHAGAAKALYSKSSI